MMKQQVCIDRTSMFSGTVNNSEVYNCWQCLFQLVNKLLQQWLNHVGQHNVVHVDQLNVIHADQLNLVHAG